ncbi:hypothetical protein BJ322DRAFT_985095, partial [Thelephora terrestris]
WLKAYLNLGEERPTWAYFANAIIGTDIPPSHNIDNDPESRITPIIQSWKTRERGSTLPEDLKAMLQVAREFNVQLSATNPSKEVKENLPIWYHAKSDPTARRLYKTKTAKCLRKKHNVRLVKDATELLTRIGDDHRAVANCTCHTCAHLQNKTKCPHPYKCINLLANLIQKIKPKWNPTLDTTVDARDGGDAATENQERDPEEVTFDKGNETSDLRDAITIFGDAPNDQHEPTPTSHRHNPTHLPETTVYTDGACNNNGAENATAGYGIWYDDNDPRNLSARVYHKNQSNQTGELIAVLTA